MNINRDLAIKDLTTEQLFGHLLLRLQDERGVLLRGAASRQLAVCHTHVEDAYYRYVALSQEDKDEQAHENMKGSEA